MKLLGVKRQNCGMTMLEAVVIIFSLLILLALLVPAMNTPRMRNSIGCVSNLKQIGMTFRVWAGDNRDEYPMAISITNGGAMELAAIGNAGAVFESLSNGLVSPQILVCPADRYARALTDFNVRLSSRNVSYFINPDATEANPQDVMLGDDNLQVRGARVKSGRLELSSNTAVSWTPDRHGLSAHLAMADGSVQRVNNVMFKAWLDSTNTSPIRLAIP